MNLDPAITLFGKRIQVEDFPCHNYDEHHGIEVIKEVSEEEPMENDEPDNSTENVMDESINTPELSKTTDDSEKVIDSKKDSDPKKDEKESSEIKEQLKKPDKILPCPRCKSMDTKFCYYNNYNVNQPRHFCKACQRYWTAGGTMRNVPVGAGRRKNKNSAARFCRITVSEDGLHHPGIKTLTFGSDNQGVENVDDRSSGLTVTAVSMDEQSKKNRSEPNPHYNGFANPMQCFQGPYMWHPAVPFCPTVFPMPIFHHPYWNGSPVPWNVPWVPNPNSPTLGKHTRDGEIITPSMNNSSSSTSTSTTTTTSTILTPKTLRIDDPNEAAKSSIWTTLGIRKDKGDSVSRGFFNSLQSKEVEKNDREVDVGTAFKANQANPVALCRSVNFQERV